jgi:hypothetical protein
MFMDSFHLCTLYFGGIITDGEAETYINIANKVNEGQFDFRLNFILYTGYIAILGTLKFLGIAYKWMYLIQFAVATVALWCFVKILSGLVSSRIALLVSSILFATSPFFFTWTTFLYTDGLFANLVIISTYLLTSSNKSKLHTVLLLAALFIIPFFRPVGLLFLPVAIVYWATHLNAQNTRLIFASSVYFLCLLFLIYKKPDPIQRFFLSCT